MMTFQFTPTVRTGHPIKSPLRSLANWVVFFRFQATMCDDIMKVLAIALHETLTINFATDEYHVGTDEEMRDTLQHKWPFVFPMNVVDTMGILHEVSALFEVISWETLISSTSHVTRMLVVANKQEYLVEDEQGITLYHLVDGINRVKACKYEYHHELLTDLVFEQGTEPYSVICRPDFDHGP